MAAQLLSLGLITVAVAGTPVAVKTALPADPASDVNHNVHAVIFQTKPGNTGRVYIGLSTMNKTTLVGVLGMLAIPSNNVLPTFTLALAFAANSISLDDLYLDVDQSGEGAVVSAIIA